MCKLYFWKSEHVFWNPIWNYMTSFLVEQLLLFTFSDKSMCTLLNNEVGNSIAAGAFVFIFAGTIIVVWGILSSSVDQIIFCYNKKIDTTKLRYYGL